MSLRSDQAALALRRGSPANPRLRIATIPQTGPKSGEHPHLQLSPEHREARRSSITAAGENRSSTSTTRRFWTRRDGECRKRWGICGPFRLDTWSPILTPSERITAPWAKKARPASGGIAGRAFVAVWYEYGSHSHRIMGRGFFTLKCGLTADPTGSSLAALAVRALLPTVQHGAAGTIVAAPPARHSCLILLTAMSELHILPFVVATSGAVAKWLRQRIANPPSSVRIRPAPL